MMSKDIGIMTTMMYTLDTSLQTAQNVWAGANSGKTVRAVSGFGCASGLCRRGGLLFVVCCLLFVVCAFVLRGTRKNK
jgi:hypothetical protein